MPLIGFNDLPSLIEALKSVNPGIPFAGKTEITYRFLTSTAGPGQFNAADYNNSGILQTDPNVLAIKNTANFRVMDAAEQAVVRSVMGELSRMLNITIREASATERGDIRFGTTALAPDTAGVNIRTSANAPVLLNDVFLDKLIVETYESQFGANAYAAIRSLVIHEVGHAFGLKHSFYEPVPGGNSALVPPLLSNTLFTQMAYDPYSAWRCFGRAADQLPSARSCHLAGDIRGLSGRI
jgi:hypothetical protein